MLVATAASRSAIDGKQGRSEGGKGRAAAVMEWEGGSAGERASEHSRPGIDHGGSGAARHRGRGTAASARALKCLRARAEQRVSEGEREGREKESGEREKKSAV